MTRRSKAGRKQLKRLEILRSAAETFRRLGFERAGMREIGDAAGMAHGNLYYYFRNKTEVLYFCQDYALDRMLEIVAEVEKSREAADAKLARLIMGQMRCMLDEVQGAAAHAEFGTLPPHLLKRVIAKRDRYEQALRRVIEEGIRARTFRKVDPKVVSLAILGAVNWTSKWFRPDGDRDVDELAGEFADYLIGGLK